MIDESMDKEQMALESQPWEFRSKPAYQRLIIKVGGVNGQFHFGFYIAYRNGICIMVTFTANADLKDGLPIENKALENVGLQTGEIKSHFDGRIKQ
jgi:regulator of sigma E protease